LLEPGRFEEMTHGVVTSARVLAVSNPLCLVVRRFLRDLRKRECCFQINFDQIDLPRVKLFTEILRVLDPSA
jgi:hypothetical protein